jgi:hypothetical protein
MSITCARCHNHPLEKRTQMDYYGMANLFSRVRVADPELPLRIVSVIPPPDIAVAAEPTDIILEPGKTRRSPSPSTGRTDFRGAFPVMSSTCRRELPWTMRD